MTICTIWPRTWSRSHSQGSLCDYPDTPTIKSRYWMRSMHSDKRQLTCKWFSHHSQIIIQCTSGFACPIRHNIGNPKVLKWPASRFLHDQGPCFLYLCACVPNHQHQCLPARICVYCPHVPVPEPVQCLVPSYARVAHGRRLPRNTKNANLLALYP